MADQFYDDIPALANQISDDVDQTEKTLGYIKDVFQAFVNSWSDTTATNIKPKVVGDADNDTLIQCEESADEDIIRFDTGGTQRMIITATGLVGIGTASPDDPLHIVADAGGDCLIFERTDKFKFSLDGAGGCGFYDAQTTSWAWFKDGTGFGIGTATPAYELQVNGTISGLEKSADPTEPAEGSFVIWMSDGTGYGDDGDICIASQAGGTTNKAILFDHSAGTAW
jgi:hypothetical protein